MSSDLKNFVRQRRQQRGWSQQDLAQRAEIARASVSAIEMGRLVPSAAAALRLAAALGCRVEDLFQLVEAIGQDPSWAWQPANPQARYWQAEVGSRQWLFPVEATYAGTLAHDGVAAPGNPIPQADEAPPTLVMACCDPAVALLSAEVARSGVRLLPFFRSSRQALGLLKQGQVHVAGIHLGHAGAEGNAAAVRAELGDGYRLVRVAEWEEGIVTPSDRTFTSLRAISRAKLRWVGREPGSGARQCLDEILASRVAPRRIARDHRGVAEAVRGGWADAGVCLRLVGEEAALEFLPVRSEAYDLCFPDALTDDPRIRALLAALRSTRYRRQLDELPGYQSVPPDDELVRQN